MKGRIWSTFLQEHCCHRTLEPLINPQTSLRSRIHMSRLFIAGCFSRRLARATTISWLSFSRMLNHILLESGNPGCRPHVKQSSKPCSPLNKPATGQRFHRKSSPSCYTPCTPTPQPDVTTHRSTFVAQCSAADRLTDVKVYDKIEGMNQTTFHVGCHSLASFGLYT